MICIPRGALARQWRLCATDRLLAARVTIAGHDDPCGQARVVSLKKRASSAGSFAIELDPRCAAEPPLCTPLGSPRADERRALSATRTRLGKRPA